MMLIILEEFSIFHQAAYFYMKYLNYQQVEVAKFDMGSNSSSYLIILHLLRSLQLHQKGKVTNIIILIHLKHNSMAATLFATQHSQAHTQVSDEEVERSSDRMFRHLSHQVQKYPLLNKQLINREVQGNKIISNQNSIKPRAFSKVVTWMKKLSNQTLQFSNETLEVSVRILKEYLEISCEPSSNLQMLGCISLHLASKINEKCIVSVQSYMECCLNIFTKEEFEIKEAEVYEKLNCQIPSLTFHGAFDFLNFEITNQSILTETERHKMVQLLEEIILNLDFLEADPLNLMCHLFAEIHSHPGQKNINAQEFSTILKLRVSGC